MEINVTVTPPLTLTVQPQNINQIIQPEQASFTFEAYIENSVALEVAYEVGPKGDRGDPGPQGPIVDIEFLDPGDLTLIFDNQVI